MRKICLLAAFIFLSGTLAFTGKAGAVSAKVYRLGFPLRHEMPHYQWLLDGLEKKGLVAGENLQLVFIDLAKYQETKGQQQIRQELATQCDLFFTDGATLEVLNRVEPHSPVLYVSFFDSERVIPKALQANSSGIRIGSEAGFFEQAVEMLPPDQRRKMGLLYAKGSRVSLLASGFQSTCGQLGFELVAKEYNSATDIASVMKDFKAKGVGSVMLCPSRDHTDDLAELIHWQNSLKLPIFSILKEDIQKGLFGGPTINKKVIMPSLADYAAKILQGRSPSQLPVKYFSPEYVVNLATASRLGINVPQEVVSQADIVGFANVAQKNETVSKPLVQGNFVLGISKHTAVSGVGRFLKEFAKRGYVQGKNLRVQQFDLDWQGDPLKQQAIARRLAAETDVIFANGSVLPAFANLPDLKTPVCFVATKETAATIPPPIKHYFTGIIRASFSSIVESARQIIPEARKIVMIGRPGSKLAKTIKRHQRTADAYGITLDYRLFKDKEEIGPLMRELHEKNDVMLLYSPGVDDACIAEIIKWQNQLKFPVLAQFERHVRQGVLAGMVVDMDKVSPKLAEYTDKLLQGRSPEQLPYYYYQGKLIINLRTASKLKLDIPVEVTSQAKIFH